MEVTNGMADILSDLLLIVKEVPKWVSETVGVITADGNEIILFSTLLGLCGVGVGMIRRFFRLHA